MFNKSIAAIAAPPSSDRRARCAEGVNLESSYDDDDDGPRSRLHPRPRPFRSRPQRRPRDIARRSGHPRIFFALALVCAASSASATPWPQIRQAANADTAAANADTSSNGSANPPPEPGQPASRTAAQPASDSSAAPVVVQTDAASGPPPRPPRRRTPQPQPTA